MLWYYSTLEKELQRILLTVLVLGFRNSAQFIVRVYCYIGGRKRHALGLCGFSLHVLIVHSSTLYSLRKK